MEKPLFYSFIIPVYNRPHEVEELLDSFSKMDTAGIQYEILIVEDGSTEKSDGIVKEYQAQLPVNYFFKKNSGPGASRNYGMQIAKGNYFIILDSDVLMPSYYLRNVDQFLQKNYVDCFGGADAASDSFSEIQKAINFTMTSILTTGGIRGKEKAVKKFEPRSFNMGMSKEVFEVTQGYGKIHPGEDPDLSLRIEKAGFKTAFLPKAEVFHKRRIDWEKFRKQVYKFGMVRPILNSWHPESKSIVFWFPSVFMIGAIIAILALSVGFEALFLLYFVYFLAIFTLSSIENKSVVIGFYSVMSTVFQFFGYGYGFLKSFFYVRILKKDPREQFPELFFK